MSLAAYTLWEEIGAREITKAQSDCLTTSR